MNKRMERLVFQSQLEYRLIRESFDDLFSDDSFASQFNEFISTYEGKQWLLRDSGLKFQEWQRS